MRITAVGNFFPQVSRSATFLTGLTYCLSRVPGIEHVTVLCPYGSELPETIDPATVCIRPCWSNASPWSVLWLGVEAIRASRRHEVLFFNIYPTAFGRSQLTNGVGLALPVAASLAGSAPVITYMHNFLETQLPEGLGYRPGKLATFAVKLLEGLILKFTVVFVPLEVHRVRVKATHGTSPERWFLPFLDAVCSRKQDRPPSRPETASNPKVLRLMIFGAFGPQKDVESVVSVLQDLTGLGVPLHLTLAGTINPNFPEARTELTQVTTRLPPSAVDLILEVPEARLGDVFRDQDVLILPYKQAGGYSGAMNLGAYYGLKLVATDLPELRECASMLAVDCRFYPRNEPEALSRIIRQLVDESRGSLPKGQVVGHATDGDTLALQAVSKMVDRISDLLPRDLPSNVRPPLNHVE